MKESAAASLAASVAEGFEATEGTEASEATVDETTTPSTDGAQADVELQDAAGTQSETEAVATAEGTDDLPDSYFEVDLSGLPAEEKRLIMDALKARDDKIGKLLRGAPEGDQETDGAAGAAGEQEAPPTPVSDEDILKQLGLDPENPFDETATKVAIPLVRALQGLSEQVNGLIEDRELEQMDRYWTSELDRLETANGQLPINRIAVIEYAAQNGLQNPEAAYWQIAGPAKRQVEKLTDDARKRLAAAPKVEVKKPTSVRPAAGGSTEEASSDAKTVRGAVSDVGRSVLRDLGIGD